MSTPLELAAQQVGQELRRVANVLEQLLELALVQAEAEPIKPKWTPEDDA